MITTLEPSPVAEQVRGLMDVAVGLAEFTRFPGYCEEIPRFLQTILGGENISMAIIRHPNEFVDPTVLHCSDCSTVPHAEGALEREMLERYRRTAPIWGTGFGDGPALAGESSLTEITLESEEQTVSGILLNQPIDAAHRLLLIIWQGANLPSLSSSTQQSFELIADVLARQIVPVVAWQAMASALGEPFSRLSQKEWVVTRALYSDICEKQMAVRLGMRQHTLHSHIKSIYRKVGVQGRLHLLSRLDASMRHARTRQVRHPVARVAQEELVPALA